MKHAKKSFAKLVACTIAALAVVVPVAITQGQQATASNKSDKMLSQVLDALPPELTDAVVKVQHPSETRTDIFTIDSPDVYASSPTLELQDLSPDQTATIELHADVKNSKGRVISRKVIYIEQTIEVRKKPAFKPGQPQRIGLEGMPQASNDYCPLLPEELRSAVNQLCAMKNPNDKDHYTVYKGTTGAGCSVWLQKVSLVPNHPAFLKVRQIFIDADVIASSEGK